MYWGVNEQGKSTDILHIDISSLVLNTIVLLFRDNSYIEHVNKKPMLNLFKVYLYSICDNAVSP